MYDRDTVVDNGVGAFKPNGVGQRNLIIKATARNIVTGETMMM